MDSRSPLTAPDFSLRQLSYLIAVADAGTIVAAARSLHISPSAVSDALTELETSLGSRLCVRRKAHGVTLTPAGLQVVNDGRMLLREAAAIQQGLRSSATELAGPIAIGCYPTLAPIVLPPLLSEFGAEHPQVDMSLVEVTHDQLAGRLESGEIDVAFVYDTMIPGIPRRASLFRLPAHVLLAADHPLAGQPTVRLDDLIEQDLILLDSPPSATHTLSLFEAQGLRPRIRHRTSNYEAVRTLVGRGLGYSVLVQRPRNPASYEGFALVMKEIDPPVEPVAVDVIWSAEHEPSARVRALVEFAKGVQWPRVQGAAAVVNPMAPTAPEAPPASTEG
ncbi:MAG: LysR family transcriptional regulator [Subtercola sp.]|nr:LysR family transcriptional regulator [Subtercola sp.]